MASDEERKQCMRETPRIGTIAENLGKEMDYGDIPIVKNGCHSQPKLFIDPIERRRRILEKSDERMRKILGHSASTILENYGKVMEMDDGDIPIVRNGCHSQPNLFIDPIERRRRILEKSDERMRKILGHSARVDDKPAMSKYLVQESQYMKTKKCLPNMCESVHTHEGQRGLNIYLSSFPMTLILVVFLIKIVSLLEIFEVLSFGKPFSFMVPFLILECSYLVYRTDTYDFSIMRAANPFGDFGNALQVVFLLKTSLITFEKVLLHFSIYFVSLCLLHTF